MGVIRVKMCMKEVAASVAAGVQLICSQPAAASQTAARAVGSSGLQRVSVVAAEGHKIREG